MQRIPFEAGGPQDGEGEVEIRQFYEMDEVPGDEDEVVRRYALLNEKSS